MFKNVEIGFNLKINAFNSSSFFFSQKAERVGIPNQQPWEWDQNAPCREKEQILNRKITKAMEVETEKKIG